MDGRVEDDIPLLSSFLSRSALGVSRPFDQGGCFGLWFVLESFHVVVLSGSRSPPKSIDGLSSELGSRASRNSGKLGRNWTGLDKSDGVSMSLEDGHYYSFSFVKKMDIGHLPRIENSLCLWWLFAIH